MLEKSEFPLKFDTLSLQKLDLSSVSIIQRLQSLEKKDAELPEAGDDAFGQLDTDVQVSIFRYLTARELCRVASVSKYWNALSSLNTLWQRLGEGTLSFSLSTDRYKDSYKKYKITMLELTKAILLPKEAQSYLAPLRPPLPFFPVPMFNINPFSNSPMQSGDTTIYAPDLHPFDDSDPSTDDTQALQLLP